MYGINKNGLSIIGTPKSTGSVIPKMDGIRPIFPTDLKRLLFARNANINVKPNVHPIPPICATIPKVFAKICGSSCPAAKDNIECTIAAYPDSEMGTLVQLADCILLGPQIGFKKNTFI